MYYDVYAQIRDAKNMTDYAVAKQAGIGSTTLYDWKSGRSTPKLEKLVKIARVLDVDVSEIVDELH